MWASGGGGTGGREGRFAWAGQSAVLWHPPYQHLSFESWAYAEVDLLRIVIHSPLAVYAVACHHIKILGSIVVSISACHAEDPGSIPGRGVFQCVLPLFISR